MSNDLPPLPASLRALLDRATSGPAPSPAVSTRLKERIDHAIAGHAVGAPRIPTALGKLVLGSALVVTAAITAHSRAVGPPATSPAMPDVSAAAEPEPVVVTSSAAPPPAAPAAVPRPAAAAVHEQPAQASEPEPVVEIERVPAPAVTPRERLLVEQARRAVAARDGATAIRVLDAHQAEFPDGTLAEEREALMVQALGLVSNRLAAAARARAFHARYPGSIFTEQVDAAAPDPQHANQEQP